MLWKCKAESVLLNVDALVKGFENILELLAGCHRVIEEREVTLMAATFSCGYRRLPISFQIQKLFKKKI